MKRALSLFICLAGGIPLLAQANLVVQNNTRVNIGSGSTLKSSGNVTISGASARIGTIGILRLESTAPTALTASSGGGVLCENTNMTGNVTWNMQQAAGYAIPFVTAAGTAVPVVVTPTSSSGTPRIVSVTTFPTLPNNTPLPPTVTNTNSPSGGGDASASMSDRYWKIGSANMITVDVRLSFAAVEDPVNGLAQMRGYNWGLTNWTAPPAGQSNPSTREVVIPAQSINILTSNTYAVARNTALQNSVQVAARVFLEGPYNTGTGTMTNLLRTLPSYPLTEPYTALGFPQAGGGGGETIPASVLSTTGPNAIVDWLMLDLRSSANNANVLATRCALVQSDGDVVDLNGTSPVAFPLANGSYFVAARHRNHLGAMTLNTVALTTSPTTVDLTNAATATYGSGARKTVGSVQALYAGNVIPNTEIKYTGSGNDRDPILVKVGSNTPNNAFSGYCSEDVNLDGQAKYTGSGNDRDPILVNVGSTTPNAVRVQQLP